MSQPSPSITDRETLVHMAKISEQAERYEEMVGFMKSLCKLKIDLTLDERVLLSTAYKKVIGSRRSSWRVIHAIENHGGYEHIEMTQLYKRNCIEEELEIILTDFIDILNTHLIPNVNSDETEVYYHKMKGDFYRYLAEFQTDEIGETSTNACKESYQIASQIAHMNLSPTHPIRLSLALNFSVFYYEVLNSVDRACHVAKEAFDDAINELDGLSEETYKDSTLIIQLLRDNLYLWAADPLNVSVDDGGEIQAEDF